ncbi:MAG: NAD-dependent epimerase/dehydratase family protein, partial [Pseudomonadota bacterium]
MPKCLVTGASGFVGSRLCRYLVDSGWHVVAFVVPDAPLDQLHPIANRIQVEKVPAEAWAFIDLFEREKFDLVFHLASVFLSEHRPEHISQMIGANVTF